MDVPSKTFQSFGGDVDSGRGFIETIIFFIDIFILYFDGLIFEVGIPT